MNYEKVMKFDYMCMKMKLIKKKKYIFAAKNFTLGTCSPNYSRFYVEAQQELYPFYNVM